MESTDVRVTEDEGGASLVEYALLVSLIAIAALLGVVFFGDSLGGSFSTIGSNVAAS